MIEALATADPKNNDYQKSLQEALSWLAQARMAGGRIDESIGRREQHVALLTRLLARTGDVFYRQKLVPAERSLGNLYWMRGDIGPATQHFRASLDHSSRLLAVEPANTQWLESAFQLQLDFAQHLASAGNRAEAAPLTDDACTSVQSLLAKDARVPTWRAGLRDCWMVRSQLALSSGSPDRAVKNAQRAVAVAKSVQSFDRVGDAVALARAYRMLGDAERAISNTAAAQAAWSGALTAFPKGSALRPSEMSEDLLILQRLGRTGEARPIAARLQTIGYRAAG
jgi:tetratricopeptide (TPR) repeat protein